MNERSYPLADSSWDDAELDAMQRVIDSRRFTMGAEVAGFERVFADYVGTRHAVMVNSGSSANLILLAALRFHSKWGWGADDPGEVIVPAVSWGTTYYPVSQTGLKLRFVDVAAGDWNVDVVHVAEAIGPQTRGIFAVNLLGAPAALPRLRELADAHDIFLIEDNCESLGAEIDGQLTGSFGVAGTHSAFFSHHISTMEGGLITTDDEELRELMISLRAHGWLRGLPPENHVHALTGDPFLDSFTFVLPGYNVRPLELSGAIGQEQMKKLPAMVEQRRRNAERFLSVIAEVSWLRPQQPVGASSWFGFGFVVAAGAPHSRNELAALLAEASIECRPIVAGNFTRNPVLAHLPHAPVPPLPVADQLHEHGLFVGNHHFGLDDQLEYLRERLT